MSSSAPPPGPPSGPPPGAPQTPPPASSGIRARTLPERVDWRGAVRTDWVGPLKVAGTILGVSALLAVLIGLGGRPGVPGLHWTLRTTLVFLGWLWTSAFGADLTASVSVSGLQGDLGAGTFALTITIVSLGAGVWLFRRRTAALTSAWSVGWFAARTAVLTAIPPLVVSWILYADQGDLLHLVDQRVNPFLGLHPSDLTVGLSSMGSFFLTLLLTLATLLLTAVVRRDLLTGRAEQVRGCLAGPVVGAGVLIAGLIPLGAVAAIFIWLFHLGQPSTTSLTWHEWMNVVAAVIAYAPSLALWQLGLGSAGRIHASASTSLGGASLSTDKGLGYWAGGDGINHGMWFAVALAPILLVGTAYAVVRLSRRHGLREQRVQLVTWVVSLLVLLPLLFHFSSLHAHASASGFHHVKGGGSDSLFGMFLGVSSLSNSIPNTISGHADAGPGASAVFLVFLYAAVLAVLVALATRSLTRESLAGLRGTLGAGPGETTLTDTTISHGGATGPYQPGDVVNGWRWTGTEWVPAQQE